MITLDDFEGLPVVATGITIPNAAGGFREPLEVEPKVFHHGDEVYATLKLRCRRVYHDPVDKEVPDGDQRRVHVFDAVSATFVDEAQASADLDAQAERIRLAKEGPSLFDGPDAELAAAHDAGEHRELVDGCEECEHERRLVAEEDGEA
jgi:hypothetical protein